MRRPRNRERAKITVDRAIAMGYTEPLLLCASPSAVFWPVPGGRCPVSEGRARHHRPRGNHPALPESVLRGGFSKPVWKRNVHHAQTHLPAQKTSAPARAWFPPANDDQRRSSGIKGPSGQGSPSAHRQAGPRQKDQLEELTGRGGRPALWHATASSSPTQGRFPAIAGSGPDLVTPLAGAQCCSQRPAPQSLCHCRQPEIGDRRGQEPGQATYSRSRPSLASPDRVRLRYDDHRPAGGDPLFIPGFAGRGGGRDAARRSVGRGWMMVGDC